MTARIINRTLTLPPDNPAEGDAYIIAAPADGVWGGHDGEYAAWLGNFWRYVSLLNMAGMIFEDLATGETLIWNYSDSRLDVLSSGGPSSYMHVGTTDATVWNLAGAGSNAPLTTVSVGLNVLHGVPFFGPSAAAQLDRIACEVTTLGAGNARLGIYRGKGRGNVYPGALVLDAGEVSVATTGVKTLTIAQVLEPGVLYCAVILPQVNAVIRGFNLGGQIPLLGFPAVLGTAANTHITVAQTYGALPATFPSGGALLTTGGPALFYRLAAA